MRRRFLNWVWPYRKQVLQVPISCTPTKNTKIFFFRKCCLSYRFILLPILRCQRTCGTLASIRNNWLILNTKYSLFFWPCFPLLQFTSLCYRFFVLRILLKLTQGEFIEILFPNQDTPILSIRF
jgi:hypothetical protein